MATAAWTNGAADGDFTNTANWTGGSGTGGVPGAGDDVVIATGATDIDTNANGFALVAINSLSVSPGFTGAFGSNAEKITFASIADVDYSSYGPSGYIKSTMTDVRVKNGVAGDDYLHLDDTVTTLRVSGGRGTVTVDSATALTNLYVLNARSASVVVSDNVTGFTLAEIDSGSVTFNVACGTVDVNGGVLVWEGTGGASTKLTVNGGTVRYNSSGTIASLVGYAGVFDGTGNENPSVTFTAAEIHEGCTFDLRSGLRNFASPVTYYGGVALWDAGQTVSVS